MEECFLAFFASDADARFGYVPPGWHQHLTLKRAKQGEWEKQFSFAALMVPEDASDARCAMLLITSTTIITPNHIVVT